MCGSAASIFPSRFKGLNCGKTKVRSRNNQTDLGVHRSNSLSRSKRTSSPEASDSYLQRTEWNVRDTDGTVVFTLGAEETGGSLKTQGFARKRGKPCVHIARDGGSLFEPALQLQEFVKQHVIKRLNVAGSRESKEPGIYQWVMQVLDDAFFPES